MNLQDIANKHLTNKFTFDEASGNITDSKGSAIGMIYGGVTRVTGYNGQGNALSFDGTNGYVQLDQKILPVNSPLSIRFKIKVAGVKNERILATSKGTDAGIVIGYNGINATGEDIFIHFNNGTTGVNINSGYRVGDNQWHDVLITWNGTTSDSGLKLYVDNLITPVFVGKAPFVIASHTSNLRIGNDTVGTTIPFSGELDELEIYNETIDLILQNKFSVVKNNDSYYSLADKTLIHLPSTSNQNMILHGVEQGKEIQLDVPFDKVKLIQDTSEVLGEGKTFTHTIDLSEIKAKKIIL